MFGAINYGSLTVEGATPFGGSLAQGDPIVYAFETRGAKAFVSQFPMWRARSDRAFDTAKDWRTAIASIGAEAGGGDVSQSVVQHLGAAGVDVGAGAVSQSVVQHLGSGGASVGVGAVAQTIVVHLGSAAIAVDVGNVTLLEIVKYRVAPIVMVAYGGPPTQANAVSPLVKLRSYG